MKTSSEFAGVLAQLNHLSRLQEFDNEALQAVELALVGTGIGIGTVNLDTNKLSVLNYKRATKFNDTSEWKKEIEAEYKDLRSVEYLSPF
jgi:hypothetical protein